MSRILLTQASRHVWSRLTFVVRQNKTQSDSPRYSFRLCSFGDFLPKVAAHILGALREDGRHRRHSKTISNLFTRNRFLYVDSISPYYYDCQWRCMVYWAIIKNKNEPNQSLQPTTMLVTDPAAQALRQAWSRLI